MSDEVDGRVRRGQESREARRGQIKDSALRVFSERGYHQTSVTDLVEAAGVARGTFYLYFDSKEAIFLELLDDLTTHLRDNIGGVDATRGVTTIEQQLHQIVVRILRTAVENRPLTRIIFREAVGLHASVDARLRAFDDELYGFVAGALRLGAALGALRAVDADVVAVVVVGALREVVHRYVVRDDAAFDLDAVAAAVLDQQLRGLLAG
ncbi:MAG: helix-turn-helix domain-containing protein [Myxococcota bacterium]